MLFVKKTKPQWLKLFFFYLVLCWGSTNIETHLFFFSLCLFSGQQPVKAVTQACGNWLSRWRQWTRCSNRRWGSWNYRVSEVWFYCFSCGRNSCWGGWDVHIQHQSKYFCCIDARWFVLQMSVHMIRIPMNSYWKCFFVCFLFVRGIGSHFFFSLTTSVYAMMDRFDKIMLRASNKRKIRKTYAQI